MAGAKSLIVLCFLLVIATTSHAANCKFSICYHACRKVFSKETCSKNCHCSLITFVNPDELGRKVLKMPEALASKMEEDYNRAEAAVLEKEEEQMMMMMMEELMISLNDDKLTGKCKYQPCYRMCRSVGGSKDTCAKKCNCTQLTEVLAAGSKDIKDADDDEESATN